MTSASSEEGESVDANDDVASAPGPNADPQADVERYIDAACRSRYEVHSYRHAASILATSFPAELADILAALQAFSLTLREIAMPGGNESVVPKKFSQVLRPLGWVETHVQGDLVVRTNEYDQKVTKKGRVQSVRKSAGQERTFKNFIDGHKIDYVKGRVAFDLEWNSKDQTFDRDLYALRAFHECGLFSVGVLVTRSRLLNRVFEETQLLDEEGNPDVHKKGPKIGQPRMCTEKYGASTTWMGKLLYRLNAGRHGGCPILVFGIKPSVITDWKPAP